MNPVLFTNAAGIDHVRQVVFRVCQNEIRVRDRVLCISGGRLTGQRNTRCPLNRLDGVFRPGETDETVVEQIQPPAQNGGTNRARDL